MCHAPAERFQVRERGYIKQGYFADLVLVDPDSPWVVEDSNILSKCGWSPFGKQKFRSKVVMTFVNGHMIYDNGVFNEEKKGRRILFER